jgi:hypothetical protein
MKKVEAPIRSRRSRMARNLIRRNRTTLKLWHYPEFGAAAEFHHRANSLLAVPIGTLARRASHGTWSAFASHPSMLAAEALVPWDSTPARFAMFEQVLAVRAHGRRALARLPEMAAIRAERGPEKNIRHVDLIFCKPGVGLRYREHFLVKAPRKMRRRSRFHLGAVVAGRRRSDSTAVGWRAPFMPSRRFDGAAPTWARAAIPDQIFPSLSIRLRAKVRTAFTSLAPSSAGVRPKEDAL